MVGLQVKQNTIYLNEDRISIKEAAVVYSYNSDFYCYFAGSMWFDKKAITTKPALKFSVNMHFPDQHTCRSKNIMVIPPGAGRPKALDQHLNWTL